jgi:hypothetical protein
MYAERNIQRETAVMGLCKNPNVLRVHCSFVSGSKLYIVTPFLSAGQSDCTNIKVQVLTAGCRFLSRYYAKRFS